MNREKKWWQIGDSWIGTLIIPMVWVCPVIILALTKGPVELIGILIGAGSILTPILIITLGKNPGVYKSLR